MRVRPNKRRKPPRVVTTERDIELFQALHTHGVMSRVQIQDYFGWDCVSDANRRLRKLFDAGFVDRRFVPRKFGPTPAVYMVGNEGARVLVNERKTEEKYVNRRRYRFKNISDNLLSHELLITEFACLLKSVFRRYSGCELCDWQSDDKLADKCNLIETGGDLLLKPDAFGSYHLHKMLFNIFLEADLGTEPLARINKKVELYRSFKASGLFERNFGHKFFGLFIVVNSDTRAANISQMLPAIHDLKVFVGNIETIRIDPLFAPVWLQAGCDKQTPIHAAANLSIGGSQS